MDNLPNSRAPDAFRAGWKSRFEYFGSERDDDAGIAGWTPSGLETRFREFRRYWSVASNVGREGGVWLDIGCGAGTYTRFLADEGLRVIGVDYSLPTLLKARARSTPGLEWVAGDATRLPLRPGSARGVLCFGVLQAISASEPAIRAIAEVLEPGGVLWIDALNAQCLPNKIEIVRRRVKHRSAHLRYETARSLRETLDVCGFDMIALHRLLIAPARLRWAQRIVDSDAARWLLRRVSPVAAWASHSLLIEASRRPDKKI